MKLAFPVLLAAMASVVLPASVAETLLFRDITRDAGITFQHHASPEKKYIVESMSGGLALFDFDNDGLVDIYFVDSLTVETANQPKTMAPMPAASGASTSAASIGMPVVRTSSAAA